MNAFKIKKKIFLIYHSSTPNKTYMVKLVKSGVINYHAFTTAGNSQVTTMIPYHYRDTVLLPSSVLAVHMYKDSVWIFRYIKHI